MRRYLGSAHETDLDMAKKCIECNVCDHARKRQQGIAFWFVKNVERKICPYCEAYFRVFGRYAHEAIR